MGGKRAVLIFPPGLDYITAFLGCLYSQTVAVPAYPPVPTRLQRTLPRLLSLMRDADPAIVLVTSAVKAMAPFLLEQHPDLKELEWLATDEVEENVASNWLEPSIKPDSLAFLQYTSGSTADPRGVMLTHGNLVHNSAVISTALQTNEDLRAVFWLPLYHDMGLIGGVLGTLYCGATSYLMSPLHFLQHPFRWLDAVSRYGADISGGPNFAYDLCVRRVTSEQRATLDLSRWELAFTGAEPVRQATLVRFAEAFAECGFRPSAFYPAYGLAEATLFVSAAQRGQGAITRQVSAKQLALGKVADPLDDDDVHQIVGCGQTRLDMNAIIVNPDTRRRCPENQVGEIWVSGPSIAQGYWQKPEESEETFRAWVLDSDDGPYLRTGDLGFIEDGELFVTGRLKDLIIIGGLNHYPQDIEATVDQAHPAVRAGGNAAFSLDVNGEERLVIVAEVKRQKQLIALDAEAQETLSPKDIKRAIRSAVGRNHEVTAYDVVLLKPGNVPKTSSGKIQRGAARLGYLERSMETWEG